MGATGSYTSPGGKTDSYQQTFAYDDIGNMAEKTSTHQGTPASPSPEALQYARALATRRVTAAAAKPSEPG